MKMTRREFISLAVGASAVGCLSLAGFLNLKDSGTKGEREVVEEGEQKGTRIEWEKLREHVQVLTKKSFGGRRAGTSGEAATCKYLAQQLKRMGVEPCGDQGTFFQSFLIPEMALMMKDKRAVFYRTNNNSQQSAENVLGLIEGKLFPDKYVVLSAHLDHLGVWQDELYPGANDNASGVATLLEITRLLCQGDSALPYSVLIAFWSAEEMGLLGSRHFLQNPLIPKDKLGMNINLDSIGSGEKKDFVFWAHDLARLPEWLAVRKIANYSALVLAGQEDRLHSSDHRPFWDERIPAVTFLAKNWLKNNHTHLDVPEDLNYAKMASLGEFVLEMVTLPELGELFAY